MRQLQTYRAAPAGGPGGVPWGGPLPAGHCRQCGQPSGSCCCGCRECRKESKELLVTPQDAAKGNLDTGTVSPLGRTALAMIATQMDSAGDNLDTIGRGGAAGIGQSFIGGGCCVSLSVEYVASSPTVQPVVGILVSDSEGTTLAWIRTEQPGAGYKVKECVITTNPGSHLVVVVLNATARVRWCEIFSC
jgi:hypothetical protein